jgi:hydroxymethylglutaryl-CoA reductase
MVVVELLIDVRDSMGANLINSVCEATVPFIHQLVAQG